MASEGDAAQESVVLVSFANCHAAEHMLRSLGPGFRKRVHKKDHAGFAITDNADGSLKLTQPPVVTAILAQAGPNAAIALVCCQDQETREMVAARAADPASYSWDGSRTEFLADLDPGPKHDWVREARRALQREPLAGRTRALGVV